MRASKTTPAPLPEFTSDRLRLLGPLITPRAVELARRRILDRKFRLVGEKRDVGAESEADVKMALLLVLEMNERENLTNEEEGVIRGETANTVGAKWSAKEYAPHV